MSLNTCALCNKPSSPTPNVLGYCTPHLHLRCHALKQDDLRRTIAQSDARLEETARDDPALSREQFFANPPHPYVGIIIRSAETLKQLAAELEQEFEAAQKKNDEAAMMNYIDRWRTSDAIRHLFP